MREAYILGFRFRFVDQKGKPKGIVRDSGSITRDGIFLSQQRIFFEDVHRVAQYRNQVIISLMPYGTSTRQIADNVFPLHNCIVIQVDEQLSQRIKSVIDQRCTNLAMKIKWGHLDTEEWGDHFKHITCPRCEAITELTDVQPSALVYCKYCEAIFDHFGYILPGSEEYKICPECEYYGRVQDYRDYQAFHIGQEAEFSARSFYCCDTCAHRMFMRNVWKNMILVGGFALSAFEKLRSKRNRNPFYKELTEANYLAQNGEMVEADILYSSITFKNGGHPGLHMNYGKAYLQNGERSRAAFQFKKSLEACSNYYPTLEILKRNVDLVD